MSTIYIVQGRTGEYADRREWNVVAYRSKDEAKAHVERASAWAGQQRYGYDANRLQSPHDPFFDLDYTGTHYDYYELELIEETK